MPSGNDFSTFCDKCKSVKFTKPLISSGNSSNLWCERRRNGATTMSCRLNFCLFYCVSFARFAHFSHPNRIKCSICIHFHFQCNRKHNCVRNEVRGDKDREDTKTIACVKVIDIQWLLFAFIIILSFIHSSISLFRPISLRMKNAALRTRNWKCQLGAEAVPNHTHYERERDGEWTCRALELVKWETWKNACQTRTLAFIFIPQCSITHEAH